MKVETNVKAGGWFAVNSPTPLLSVPQIEQTCTPLCKKNGGYYTGADWGYPPTARCGCSTTTGKELPGNRYGTLK